MQERLIVGLIASGVFVVTSYFFVARPYFDRRRLRTAEEEVKILMKSKEQSTVTSQSSEATQR